MKLKYNDKQHAYWLDSKRCKGVTTVAKIPDSTYYLDKWQKRQVAIGLASDPRLLEQIAAHLDDRDSIDNICEEAMHAAKAHHAADAGTTAHRFTEAHDAGLAWIETELGKQITQTWTTALEAGGFRVAAGMVERIAVHPDHRICGTFDRILERIADGALFMADLKTGDKAINYPHSIAIQLAMYANAPLLAGPLDRKGETETFEPMPDVDKTTGIVIHMPSPDHAELVAFDIAAGWDAFTGIIVPTLAWRDRKDLTLQLDAVVQDWAKIAQEIDAPRRGDATWCPPVGNTEPFDEGPDVDKDAYDALERAYGRLTIDQSVLVNKWITATKTDGGRRLSVRQRPSLWRWTVVRAMIKMAHTDVTDDETMRWMLYGATSALHCLTPSIPLGTLFASLTVEQANRLADLAQRMNDGTIAVTFDGGGVPQFNTAA